MRWQVSISNLKDANMQKYTYQVCRNNIKPKCNCSPTGWVFPSSCLTIIVDFHSVRNISRLTIGNPFPLKYVLLLIIALFGCSFFKRKHAKYFVQLEFRPEGESLGTT